MHHSLTPALCPDSAANAFGKQGSKDGKDGKDGKDDSCIWPMRISQDDITQ